MTSSSADPTAARRPAARRTATSCSAAPATITLPAAVAVNLNADLTLRGDQPLVINGAINALGAANRTLNITVNDTAPTTLGTGGVTLFELVLVMAVMVLIAAIAVPSIDAMYGRAKITAAADAIRRIEDSLPVPLTTSSAPAVGSDLTPVDLEEAKEQWQRSRDRNADLGSAGAAAPHRGLGVPHPHLSAVRPPSCGIDRMAYAATGTERVCPVRPRYFASAQLGPKPTSTTSGTWPPMTSRNASAAPL